MQTDVVRKSPRVARIFCGYCACRRLLYVIILLHFPFNLCIWHNPIKIYILDWNIRINFMETFLEPSHSNCWVNNLIQGSDQEYKLSTYFNIEIWYNHLGRVAAHILEIMLVKNGLVQRSALCKKWVLFTLHSTYKILLCIRFIQTVKVL